MGFRLSPKSVSLNKHRYAKNALVGLTEKRLQLKMRDAISLPNWTSSRSCSFLGILSHACDFTNLELIFHFLAFSSFKWWSVQWLAQDLTVPTSTLQVICSGKKSQSKACGMLFTVDRSPVLHLSRGELSIYIPHRGAQAW